VQERPLARLRCLLGFLGWFGYGLTGHSADIDICLHAVRHPDNTERIVEACRREAGRGDRRAQYYYGLHLEQKIRRQCSTSCDYSQSFELYRRASASGLGVATDRLALLSG